MMSEDILRRNNVKVSGHGERVMVFAHGLGCDQTFWRFITPSFEKNYRVVLFDYVGSGGSDRKAYHEQRYSSLNGYVMDVIEICEALNVYDTIFVGHSVSGMIGLLAAIRRPELFSELILIAPSPRYMNDQGYEGGYEKDQLDELLNRMDSDYIAWANDTAPAVMKNPDKPELARELSESFRAGDPRVVLNFAMATFFSDNRKDLLQLKKPSLILQCSDDRVVPLAVGDYLHAHLENSTLKVLNASGHYPHLSHPVETTRMIRQYLRKRS